MHIGFDGTCWGGEESGVATSTRRLFQELSANSGRHRYTAFLNRRALDSLDAASLGPTTRLIVVRSGPRGVRIAWQQVMLPRLAHEYGLDLLYAPVYTVPLACRVPMAVTIHDTIAWQRPELCRPGNVIHFRAMVTASVRRAQVITTPTRVVAVEVVRRLGVDPDRVHIVPWGADAEIVPVPRDVARALVRHWYGIEAPYVLHVGAMEPKKNLLALRRALSPLGIRLVLAGAGGWQGKRARREILGDDGTCRHLTWVPTERLGALYSAAELLAFPSHIEGFGLPVVEAMACGTPVVVSEDPALLEVSGGAALHVAADDVAGLAQCVRCLIEDDTLREQLSARGRARAAEFTWRRTRERFLAAIHPAR